MLYIATRLYDFSEKIKADCLERALKSKMKCHTFVPFRDTAEHKIVGLEKTKIIYEQDMSRLNSGNIELLVALYDDICKDEGISFEIGYAYGKNIPIYLICTDFIWYEINNREFIFDPIIEQMICGYTHYYHIEDDLDFRKGLEIGQSKAFDLASENILNLKNEQNDNHLKSVTIEYDVFLEVGGLKYEYQKDFLNWFISEMSNYQIKIITSTRYSDGNSQNDINNLLKSKILICFGDEIELGSGSAALIGLAKSQGKMIVLYETSQVMIIGENEHRMKKNLMIDFSVDIIAKSKNELIQKVKEELCLKN